MRGGVCGGGHLGLRAVCRRGTGHHLQRGLPALDLIEQAVVAAAIGAQLSCSPAAQQYTPRPGPRLHHSCHTLYCLRRNTNCCQWFSPCFHASIRLYECRVICNSYAAPIAAALVPSASPDHVLGCLRAQTADCSILSHSFPLTIQAPTARSNAVNLAVRCLMAAKRPLLEFTL